MTGYTILLKLGITFSITAEFAEAFPAEINASDGKCSAPGLLLDNILYLFILDSSKRFTLFALPGRPVHSDTNSASPESIVAMQQLCTTT